MQVSALRNLVTATADRKATASAAAVTAVRAAAVSVEARPL